MKETRTKKVFDLLNESQNYLTSDELAQRLNVSSKTVRNEIKELDRIFQNHGARIEARAGYGFRFEILDIDLFREFLATQWHEHAFADDYFALKDNRVDYLLKILLYEKDYVKADDLCEMTLVSKSQLSNDLQSVRDRIALFDLRIETKPHYGMKILGSEINIRQCIASCFFEHPDGNQMDILKEVRDQQGEEISIIREEILKVFNARNFETSELVFRNLATHLFIALERILMKEPIEMDQETLIQLKTTEEFAIAGEIVDALQKRFGVSMPEDEKGYVSMHLSGKRMLSEESDDPNVISSEVDELVVAMIERIKQRMTIDLSKDLELRIALGLHCMPLLKRIKFKLNMKNPLLADIKKHKKAFMVSYVATNIIEERYGAKLSEDEIAYFALHFYVALERLKMAVNRKRVLLVCSTGRGTAKLLQYRFKAEFDLYLESIQTMDAMSVNQTKLEDFDLVVSTVPLSVKTTVPIVYISSLLDEKDVKTIRQRINQNASSISRYFDRRLFFADLAASTKEEVLQFLCMKITELHGNPKGFLESVIKREEVAATEFGNAIAIPHPYQSFSMETVVAVAILRKPIVWKQKMVQLVFLLSYGKNENEDLEAFFEKSAQFLINPEDIRRVIQERDYDGFIVLIDKN